MHGTEEREIDQSPKKENPVKQTLNVFGYTDFRTYLRDYYEFRKNSQKGYSYRAFSKAAGFSSPNFLKLIIDGARNVSNETIEKILRATHLTGAMADYFRALANFNQAKTDEQKEKYFHKMQALMPNAKKRNLDQNAMTYLSHWIFPLIREMVDLPDFRDDPYWIARRISRPVSTQEIVDTLNFLKSNDFISKDANGKWSAVDNFVISSDEIRNLAIRNYHRQMLACAEDALQRLELDQREFGALTFQLPPSAVAELKLKLKKFRDEIHEWTASVSSSTTPDRVVQLNFQMYELTKGGQ